VSAPTPVEITRDGLIAGWDFFLLDAYGVLVDEAGALPGAAALVSDLVRAGKSFAVVTNDASRLPEKVANRLRRLGMAVTPDQVLTSGTLMADYFQEHQLAGARCMVFGTEDSCEYVRSAGGVPIAHHHDEDYQLFAACDDAGFPFLESLDMALSSLYRQCDRGEAPHLLLPNPDLVYSKARGRYGFTAGAVALLLEEALGRRYPGRNLRFSRLGKPYPPLFRAAQARAGGGSVVMVGDQLETDIAGARAAGIDAVLLGTGVSRWQDSAATLAPSIWPTHLLERL
jgi:HAD superfamily hydrolase (TIGR01450 family)